MNQDYPNSFADFYMPKGPFNNQGIPAQFANNRFARTQQSQTSSADSTPFSAPAWQTSHDGTHLTPQRASRFPSGTFHRRNNSDSSIVTPAPSPYNGHNEYTHIFDAESQQFPSPQGLDFDQYSAASYAKSLPSATGATFTETFYDFSPQPRDHADFLLYQRAMTEAMANTQVGSAEMGGATPSLPRQQSLGDYDEDPRTRIERGKIPKFDRTMSDIYQENLYNPNLAASPASGSASQPIPAPIDTQQQQQQHQQQQLLLSPPRDVFSERLQAANNDHISARRTSPSTASPREQSPFQPTSAEYGEMFPQNRSPRARMGAASQLGEPEAGPSAFPDPAQPDPSTKTVSPQDVSTVREYDGPDDDATAAFFPSTDLAAYAPAQPLKREPGAEAPTLQMPNAGAMHRASPSAYGSGAPPQNAAGAAAVQQQQIPQTYPFIQRRRPAAPEASAPQFHASLTSMESTKSESYRAAEAGAPASPSGAATPGSSSAARRSLGYASSSPRGSSTPSCGGAPATGADGTPTTPIPRPASTASDAGTYTCTYHGCPQRFETPAKLQKHKREGHRPTTPSSATGSSSGGGGGGGGSGGIGGGAGPTAGAAPGTAGTQAGPHRCDRVNPSTGKPCRSVFSRPYDLTRHEDTIHNARKQKARCPLCAEAKTFSRSDALTRHMRVVHPEVELQGKQKRKG